MIKGRIKHLTCCLLVAAQAWSGAAFANDDMAQRGDAKPSNLDRQKAADSTARSPRNACAQARPFYWEVGGPKALLASGAVGEGAPLRRTSLPIASATKWLYGAYVAEKRGGQLSDDDVRFLTFRSGYTRFRFCREGQTVDQCRAALINGRGRPDAANEGAFFYNGGHLQEHAHRMGLGALDGLGLGDEIRQTLRPVIGTDIALGFAQPQPAGGGLSNAADYASFLQAMLRGDLQLSKLLGTHAVCANPRTCPPGVALHSPMADTETWHYSIGHWVEDDPLLGDGAFSSPGAFGFYPWISGDRRWYGLVARYDRHGVRAQDPQDKPAGESVACGRLIRKAWISAQALE
ncbi:MAG: hypothetical protein KGL90_14365 [Burkholderiales bacterium]|nr:hypothetical protein [Burkholderiales bacterium]